MLIKILLAIILLSGLSFPQLGFQTSVKPNEITPVVYFGGDVSTLYSFQWNIFSVGLVPKDPYNSNKFSGSMYSIYSTGAILGIVTIFGTGGEWFGLANLLPDSSVLKTISTIISISLVAPIALSNSQHFLNLYGYNSSSTSKIALSAFVGAQTDYFDRKENKWLRLSPSSGLEFFYRITNHSINGRYDGYGVALQIGVTKHWDVLKQTTNKGPITGFINVKIHFPI